MSLLRSKCRNIQATKSCDAVRLAAAAATLRKRLFAKNLIGRAAA
jgi:hypothetical protein